MKNTLKTMVFFLPFLLGFIGYFVFAKESLGNALFYSMSFYTLSFVSEAPNFAVELARWMAPLMTAGGVILAVRSLQERVREWIAGMKEGTIAVFGPEEETAPVLSELGTRGIRIRNPERLPRAERYILLGEERENFLFYRKHKKKLEKKKVYLKCDSMNARAEQAGLKLFSEEETAARLFWKKHGIWKEAREKNYRLKIVFTEFGPLEQQMLLWGLQNNIFSPQQKLEYHIFGETRQFHAIYHELDRIEDRIVFHENAWYEEPELLKEADRIFVSDVSGSLSGLLYMLPGKTLHVLAEREEDTACFEEQNRLALFCWKKEAQRLENILDEVLLLRARRINLRYAHLYSGVEETRQNMEEEWDRLDVFTKYSNISAADYHEVRLQMLEDRKAQTGKAQPDEAFLQYLTELEHMRWCRYHYIRNWSFGIPENGKNKDAACRIHRALIPFSDLSEEEKEKDAENIRLLLSTEPL